MIDHVSFAVKDYTQSLHFYDKTLATLNYTRIMTLDIPEQNIQCAGYGYSDKPHLPHFEISPMGEIDEEIGRARGVHVAFVAGNEQMVRDWYNTCLELGGKDNGKPGPRPHYHAGYYGAFIIDPNGWRIEAAFHGYNK